MIRLVYISTARTLLSTAALGEILRVSRANNAASDVTGFLVAGGRRFLQALEGPSVAVDATFDRILRDPRHFATVVLSRDTMGDRQFGQWSMGHQPSSAGGNVTSALVNLIDQIPDATVRAQFEQFALQHAC